MSKRRKKRKSSKAKRWGIIFAVELILILILIPVVFVYATAAVIARSALFQPFRKRGEIKSFGALDFVAQGVQAYVVRRNRAQKKRKHLTLCRNPSGFRPHNQNNDYTKAPSIQHCFRFFVPDDFSIFHVCSSRLGR